MIQIFQISFFYRKNGSMHPSIYLHFDPFVSLQIWLPACISVCPFVFRSVFISDSFSACLIYVSTFFLYAYYPSTFRLSTCQSVCSLPICLSVYRIVYLFMFTTLSLFLNNLIKPFTWTGYIIYCKLILFISNNIS